MLENLKDYERSFYSQGGEDGVLERIFECVGETNRFCVEFGAKDGVELSNTAHLRLDRGWTGLLMEASAPVSDGIVQEFVTAENINALFEKHSVPEVFDLLSIDIDGNDYWVWKALDRFRPRVVVMEYNIYFRLDDPRTVPYDPERVWDESGYHGASLAALRKLGVEKGYSLVHTESWMPNAFFVESALLPEAFRDLPISDVTDWGVFKRPVDPAKRPWVRV
jgi:hypothetical protein